MICTLPVYCITEHSAYHTIRGRRRTVHLPHTDLPSRRHRNDHGVIHIILDWHSAKDHYEIMFCNLTLSFDNSALFSIFTSVKSMISIELHRIDRTRALPFVSDSLVCDLLSMHCQQGTFVRMYSLSSGQLVRELCRGASSAAVIQSIAYNVSAN